MSTIPLSELRRLFNETLDRFPYQRFDEKTKAALFSDWREKCLIVGFYRFQQGVKRARAGATFFPLIGEISPLIPEPQTANLDFQREMADLRARKKGGETFYTLADVFREYSRRVFAGEIEQSPRSLACARLWAGTASSSLLIAGDSATVHS